MGLRVKECKTKTMSCNTKGVWNSPQLHAFHVIHIYLAHCYYRNDDFTHFKGPVCGISSPFSGELAELQLAEHPLFHHLLQWLPKIANVPLWSQRLFWSTGETRWSNMVDLNEEELLSL